MVVVHLQRNFPSQLSYGRSLVIALDQFKLLYFHCMAPNTAGCQCPVSLFLSKMTLFVPPNPCCSCMVAVVRPRVYFGYILCDSNTEICLLSRSIAYRPPSKSATCYPVSLAYLPLTPLVSPWQLQLC